MGGPRGSIERKILGSLLRLGIVPLAAALGVGYLLALHHEAQDTQDRLYSLARQTASGLRLGLQSKLEVGRSVAADPQTARALSQYAGQGYLVRDEQRSLQERLGHFASAIPEPAAVTLHGPDGTTLARAAHPALAGEGRGRPPPGLRQPALTSVSRSAQTGRYAAALSLPVFGQQGLVRPAGYVTIAFDVAPLLRYALGYGSAPAPLSAENVTYQLAYNQSGLMVSARLGRPGEAKTYVLNEPLSDSVAEMLERSGPADAGADRLRRGPGAGAPRDVFAAYHEVLGEGGTYLVVFLPVSAALGPIHLRAAAAFGLWALLTAVLSVTAYRRIHNNVIRPVSLVNEGAQIIGQGDLDLTLRIDTGDEIEELAQSFNRMAQDLRLNMESLAESEERYRDLVTTIREGIFQTDENWDIAFLNPAGAEILGYDSPEAATGRNLREMIVETSDLVRMTSAIHDQGFLERTRIWLEREDGWEICVELSATQLRDESRPRRAIEGAFSDVSDRVQLEQEVRERAERLSAINHIANAINSSLEAGRLYENMVIEVRRLIDFDYAALCLLDEEGETFERWQLWPDQQRRPGAHFHRGDERFGATWAEKNMRCLILDDAAAEMPEFAAHFPESIASCLTAPLYANERVIGALDLGAARHGAFTQHDEDIMEQIAPHVAVAIRNAQLLDNLQASLREVTEAREQLHAANEELKTLDETKTNLLSNVSHELRTPLVSVMGYTDMILGGKAGPVTETQQEYLEISLRNIDRLVTLIENLLDFSRLHRGAEDLVFDSFDLVDCARSSVQLLRPVAANNSIALRFDAPGEPLFVEGDRGKLGQVFNNLLSNAIKFNHEGGEVALTLTASDDSVEAKVADTGIGIPEEALDKVFTRFYQYDSSSTRKYGGTGIGLAIAQDIARLHGGRITVNSEVGAGSTFRFTLPLYRGETAQHRTTGQPPAETRALVLLVSQDRALSAQVRRMLDAEGMDVVIAASFDSAAGLLDRYRPDSLLVDLGSHSDTELLDALLEREEVRDLPVTIMTNSDDLHNRYRTRVASRVKRSFRKSMLLSAIQLGLSARAGGAARLGGRILCVDDDPEILTFIERCLLTEGYAVTTCETGEEALEHVATRGFNLVLLDIAMPGMSGWEVCRHIKEDPALAGVSVLMVTAKPVDPASPQAREARPDGYLMKPFKHEELLELVEGVMFNTPTPLEADAP